MNTNFVPALLLAASLASAGPISQPGPAYVGATTLVTFADPDEALIPSISDGFLTVTFSSLLRASTVGDNWASWGSPPNTESATPRVLWSALDGNFVPITSVTFTFSQPLSIFGFEVEPGPTDVHTITANFFMGGTLVESVSRDVSGNAGALLFAASAAPAVSFDSVILSSDADFAVGQVRYAFTAVPEPQCWFLAATGLAALFAIARRKA